MRASIVGGAAGASVAANIVLAAALLWTRGDAPTTPESPEPPSNVDSHQWVPAEIEARPAPDLESCVEGVRHTRSAIVEAQQRLKPLLKPYELFEMGRPDPVLTRQLNDVLAEVLSVPRNAGRELHGECRDGVCRILVLSPRRDPGAERFTSDLRKALEDRLSVRGLAFEESRLVDVVGVKQPLLEQQVFAILPHREASP